MYRLMLVLIAFTGVRSPGHHARAAEEAPDGWRAYAARSEIAPRSWIVRHEDSRGSYGLGLAGRGEEAVDGRWLRTVPVTAGKHYVFTAHYQAKNVATPTRSILASVLWFDSAREQVEQAEYPLVSPVRSSDGWTT